MKLIKAHARHSKKCNHSHRRETVEDSSRLWISVFSSAYETPGSTKSVISIGDNHEMEISLTEAVKIKERLEFVIHEAKRSNNKIIRQDLRDAKLIS